MAKNSSSDIDPLFGEPLTEREIKLLRLMAQDVLTPFIYELLFMGLSTFNVEKRNIRRKLGVKTMCAAIYIATLRGLI